MNLKFVPKTQIPVSYCGSKKQCKQRLRQVFLIKARELSSHIPPYHCKVIVKKGLSFWDEILLRKQILSTCVRNILKNSLILNKDFKDHLKKTMT